MFDRELIKENQWTWTTDMKPSLQSLST